MILKEELKDPRVGFVTLTGVDLSPDLRHAKIHASIMGSASEREDTLKALNHASGFVRSQVGRRIRLRYTPQIAFVLDDSIQHVDRIFRLLNEIKRES